MMNQGFKQRPQVRRLSGRATFLLAEPKLPDLRYSCQRVMK